MEGIVYLGKDELAKLERKLIGGIVSENWRECYEILSRNKVTSEYFTPGLNSRMVEIIFQFIIDNDETLTRRSIMEYLKSARYDKDGVKTELTQNVKSNLHSSLGLYTVSYDPESIDRSLYTILTSKLVGNHCVHSIKKVCQDFACGMKEMTSNKTLKEFGTKMAEDCRLISRKIMLEKSSSDGDFDLFSEGVQFLKDKMDADKNSFIYTTGNKGFDDIINGGFKKGQLVTLCSTTGGGKSTLLLNIAKMLQDSNDLKVLYLVGEGDMSDLKDSLFAYNNQVPISKMERLIDYPETQEKILENLLKEQSKDNLNNFSYCPLMSHDEINLELIKESVDNMESRYGIKYDIIVFDYLGTLSSGNDDTNEGWRMTMEGMKRYAQSSEVIFLTACQLNKSATEREEKKKRIESVYFSSVDGSTSTQINNSADKMIIVWQHHDGKKMLYVSKERKGGKGKNVYFQWNEDTSRIEFENQEDDRKYINTLPCDLDNLDDSNLDDVLDLPDQFNDDDEFDDDDVPFD